MAALVNAEVDDIVLVNNATTGVNAVLRGMQPYWSTKPPGQDGLEEAIMVYDTVYGACGKTAQFIVDSNPALNLGVVRVPIQYPVSHEEFLAKTEAALVDARKQGIKIKIAIVDAISSLPGVVVPWREAVKLLRKHDVLSLVDGAHAVGQIALDLKQADPDFFISNCHVRSSLPVCSCWRAYLTKTPVEMAKCPQGLRFPVRPKTVSDVKSRRTIPLDEGSN